MSSLSDELRVLKQLKDDGIISDFEYESKKAEALRSDAAANDARANAGWQSSASMAGEKSKVAAGLLAIFLGTFGIHKFYLGYPTAGLIMLLVSLLTFGIGAAVMVVIALIEGIMYLTKTDADFYETYVLNEKQWF